MKFSERLGALRNEKGLTQSDIGELVHLKGGSISQYELGRAQPSFETLALMADIFECSVDYLLGLSSIRNPYSPESFTPHEAELITKYRKLNREQQIRIDERISTLLDAQKKP